MSNQPGTTPPHSYLRDEPEAIMDWLEEATQHPWTGAPVRGGKPKVPSDDLLPTASQELAYRLFVLRGSPGTTPDILYVCLRDSTGAWGWEVAATG